jgi:phosphatidate cytidylyltransferase
MSVELFAWQNPILRAYLAITVGVLLLAGTVLATMQFAFRKDVRPIWLIYRGWLVMLPMVLAAIALGRWGVIVGVMLLAIFGFKEYARATGLYRDWGMTISVYLGIAGVTAASLVQDPTLHKPGWLGLFMAMPAFVICLLLIIPIARNRVKGQLQALALSILGFLYIGWMFGHVGFLANTDHPYGYLLFLLFATQINDVAAFTFGRLFGKHPLRSNISPKKTWEGAMGALVVSLLMPFMLRFSMPHFSGWHLLLMGLIVGIGGQLGDLSISVIKRDIGIKDMGSSIPGHGGILDRIDSLVFVAPLFLHSVSYFHGLR